MTDASHGIVQQFQADQGWNETTLAGLLLDYIGNQQDDHALADFLQHAADEENAGAATLDRDSSALDDVLVGLETNIRTGCKEDALGLLFDLLHHLLPELGVTVKMFPNSDSCPPKEQTVEYGSPSYFSMLWNTYGKHPTPIRPSNDPPGE